MNRFFALILLFGAVNAFSVQAQKRTDFMAMADGHFNRGEYQIAERLYRNILSDALDSSLKIYPYGFHYRGYGFNPVTNINKSIFQLSECYRLTFQYKKAEEYAALSKALGDDDFPLAQLWYAYALQMNGKYAQAQEEYQEFMSQVTQFSGKYNFAVLGKEACYYAQDLLKKPDPVNIKELKDLNQEQSFGVALDHHGQTLYYTQSILERQRVPVDPLDPNGDKEMAEVNVNRIMEVQRQGTGWGRARALDFDLKDGEQIGGITLSKDGTLAFVTVWTGNRVNGRYKVCYSKKTGDRWTRPKELNNNVNDVRYQAMMPWYYEEKGILFFVSDRKPGYGGLDIWYCQVDRDGNAGPSTNLGAQINTAEDDVTPYYDFAGKTLYFSSNGRKGMGGFDIYKTPGDVGAWSQVVHMGYPLNSARQDTWFRMGRNLKEGFFASDREGCGTGCEGPACYRLYMIEFPPYAATGFVRDDETNEPIPGAKIIFYNDRTGVELGRTETDIEGKYFFEVEPGLDYRALAQKSSYITNDKAFSTRGMLKPDILKDVDIFLTRIVIDKPILIPNIFYDYNKATLRPESKVVLDSLVRVLTQNNNLVIEIGSHTDSKGTDQYNFKLSDARAKSVVDYMIEKGLDPKLLTWKGYGETTPVAPNENPDGSDNPEGRQMNRRTEFKVKKILEFNN